MPKSYYQIAKNIVPSIISWSILLLFQMNLLISQNPYEFFQFFSRFWKFIWNFCKINVTLWIMNIIFETRFHMTHMKFLGDWSNSSTVAISIVLKKCIFIYIKKWKNSYEFWKMTKLIQNKKRIGYLIIHWKIILFYQFFNNFSLLFMQNLLKILKH